MLKYVLKWKQGDDTIKRGKWYIETYIRGRKMKKKFKLTLTWILVLILGVGSNVQVFGQGLNRNVSSALMQAINLGFQPADVVENPTKNIVYMTDKANKMVYSVNYETNEIKSIQLGCPTERMTFVNNKLYVALLVSGHNYYGDEVNEKGAIAVIDADTFTLKETFDVNIDPFDIAVDNSDHIYISSGSSQWTNIKSFSLISKAELSSRMIWNQSYIELHPSLNMLYSIDTLCSPIDISYYAIGDNGVLSASKDSPYHGDYSMCADIKISPDGKYIFNRAGTIFKCSSNSSENMTYVGSLKNSYTDIAFDVANNKIYASNIDGNIAVYDYSTFEKIGIIKVGRNIDKLFIKNGSIVYTSNTSDGKCVIGYAAPSDVIAAITTPVNGSTNVELGADVNIKFMSNMKKTDKFSFKIESAVDPGVYYAYLGGDTLSVTHDSFKANTQYTVRLAGGSVAAADTGKIYEEEIVFSFTTKSQTFGVTSTIPTNGSTNVAVGGDIKINFPQNIKMGNGNIRLSEGSTNFSITPQISGQTLTLVHNNLNYNRTYTVSIAEGAVIDESNNNCQAYSFTFTTGSQLPALQIVSSIPKNNETEVFVNEPIKIKFNQNIKMGNGPILISGGSRSYVVSAHVENDTLCIQPDKDYEYNTQYCVTISPGAVTDLGNNPYGGGSINFTTSYEFYRLAGTDRYKTSATVSQMWSTSNFVVLAKGEDYPDALCAAPLAAALHAPILLTDSNYLPFDVEAEIDRLMTKSVIIIGGTGAISDSIRLKLEAKGLDCTRIAGQSRYETSAMIAATVEELEGGKTEAFLVTGENFPDALSVASYAASHGIPILLTEKDRLPDCTKSIIGYYNINKVYGIGGTGVISDSVLYSLPGAERIGGQNRYETNSKVLKRFQQNYQIGFFATGNNFPDALSGSALAAAFNSPIILVDPGMPSEIVAEIRQRRGEIKVKFLLGGEGAIKSSLIASIFN